MQRERRLWIAAPRGQAGGEIESVRIVRGQRPAFGDGKFGLAGPSGLEQFLGEGEAHRDLVRVAGGGLAVADEMLVRLAVLPEERVEIAMRGEVERVDSERLPQRGLGLGVAQLTAQRIGKSRPARRRAAVDGERLAERLFGGGEVAGRLFGLPEPVPGGEALGPERRGAPGGRDRAFGVADILPGDGERLGDRGAAGEAPGGVVQMALGVGEARGLDEEDAEIERRVGIVGLLLQRDAVVAFGLRRLAGGFQGVGEVVVHMGLAVAGGEGAAEEVDRLGQPPRRLGGKTEQLQGVGVGGVVVQHLPQQGLAARGRTAA